MKTRTFMTIIAFLMAIGNTFAQEIDAEILQKAKDGDIKAQFDVAYRYGQKGDYTNEILWYSNLLSNPKAEDEKNASTVQVANYNMGHKYMYGRGVTKNIHTALKFFEKAHKMGYYRAANAIAWMYVHESSIKDKDKALEWYNKAVEMGDAGCMYFLGRLYEYGGTPSWKENGELTVSPHFLGIKKDLKKAKEYYEKLVYLRMWHGGQKTDAPHALFTIAKWRMEGNTEVGTLKTDDKTVYEMLKSCLDTGNNSIAGSELRPEEKAEAAWMLSVTYRFGKNGATSNEIFAMKWAKQAAEYGHPRAMALMEYGISGTIVDENGQPAKRVKFEVIQTADSKVIHSGYTDDLGIFTAPFDADRDAMYIIKLPDQSMVFSNLKAANDIQLTIQ